MTGVPLPQSLGAACNMCVVLTGVSALQNLKGSPASVSNM